MGVAAESSGGSSRYRSLRVLARGGMARVEIAVRAEGRFRRLYALKRLRGELRDDESARAMFLEEARVAGLLRHPNVVSVLDVGEDTEGPFLVMDYVDGLSLSALMNKTGSAERPLPVQLCVRIMRDVASGLAAAHALTSDDGAPLALVHRDVSPQNILIGFDGVVRLTDFGIAKAYGRLTDTTTGILKGKISYMAPEQLSFAPVDHRTDLFAFGVVLFEMLAGKRLYHGEDVSTTARRIMNAPVPDIDDYRDDVPPRVVELLFSLLAKRPDHRPNDARAVVDRLDEILVELVRDEPSTTVADFIDASLSEYRAEQQAELRALVTADERDATEAAGAKRRARPYRLVIAAAAIVAGVVAVAIAAGLGMDRTSERGRPPVPASAAPPQAPPVSPPRAERAPPEPAAQALASPDDDAPSLAPAARARAHARVKTRRRRGPARARAARSKQPASAQYWDW